MTREEMLKKLHGLRFCVFWDGGWEDIGFTERPIWINSYGYGYYSCDEPCSFAIIDGVSDDDIKNLKQKISDSTLSVEEFKSSPFNSINDYDDEEYLESVMNDFIRLPDHTTGQIFCGEDFDGWNFYSTEEELIEAFDKKDDFFGGEAWDEMDDTHLEVWYERISNYEDLYIEFPMTLSVFK